MRSFDNKLVLPSKVLWDYLLLHLKDVSIRSFRNDIAHRESLLLLADYSILLYQLYHSTCTHSCEDLSVLTTVLIIIFSWKYGKNASIIPVKSSILV